MLLKAPAKINWFMEVLGLRDDGFHEIRSLMQKITLYDTLSFTRSQDSTLISGSDGIPPEENLVYKTALLLKDKYGIRDGVEIHIEKKIPVGAGLGGGSSDAAATLRGLNSLWSLDLTTVELCEIGEQIGSDVPFFLSPSISVVQGRGERINQRNAVKPLTLLLVKPSISISTAWAYNKLSVMSNASRDKNMTQNFRLNSTLNTHHSSLPLELTKKADKVNNIEHFIRSIERADTTAIARYAGAVSNDLESVTLKSFPVIADIKEMLDREGSVFSLMSGSGSVVFGVFESLKKAEKAAASFDDHWTAVVRTITDRISNE